MVNFRWFYLTILIYPALGYFYQPWFIFLSYEQALFITILSVLIGSLILTPLALSYFKLILDQKGNHYLFGSIIPILISLFVIYPVLTTSLGDGIGIHENIALEAGVLGYQLTMDEFLSAFLHSVVYRFFFNQPESAYRIMSTLSGIVFLFNLYIFFRKQQIGFIEYLLILSSGGMLLFFGYVENYSITTLILSIVILKGIQLENQIQSGIEQSSIDMQLFWITVLSSIAVLFHLVSGYLIFGLVYLCYISSKKNNDFIKKSIQFGSIGLIILAAPLLYFLYSAESRFDLSFTHIAHPPFYPIRKIFSINHFKEILSCMYFSTGASISLLFFILFTRFKLLTEFIKENRFVSLIVFGFILHAFLFNPLLGFPKDWDVMSIYWFPIGIFTALLIHQKFTDTDKIYIVPIIIFFSGLLFYHSIILNKRTSQEDDELKFTLNTIHHYIKTNRSKFENIRPDDKKYYLKVSYFLEKTIIETHQSKVDNSKKDIWIGQLNSFQIELNEEVKKGFQSVWKTEFLKKLTVFNTDYQSESN